MPWRLRSHASVSVAIVVAACAVFFIPTTLIVLGYYSSQPTGTLISPLPQGVVSEQVAKPTPAIINVTPTVAPVNDTVIAAPNVSTQSADTVTTPEIKNNIIDGTATIDPNTTEQTITNENIKQSSQIYLSSRPDDKSTYSVKSKTEGSFVLVVNSGTDTVRYVDYHIVNP